MLNRIELIGHVGKVEITDKMTKFSLATSDNYKDKNGEWQNITDWHNCIIWKETKIEKGQKLYVEGKSKTKEHEGKYFTNVVVSRYINLDKKESESVEKDLPF